MKRDEKHQLGILSSPPITTQALPLKISNTDSIQAIYREQNASYASVQAAFYKLTGATIVRSVNNEPGMVTVFAGTEMYDLIIAALKKIEEHNYESN